MHIGEGNKDDIFLAFFCLDASANGGPRLRKPVGATAPSTGSNVEEDIDTVLRHHHAMQDKLADEMVHLARNLKENAKVAGRIVQDDTQVCGDLSGFGTLKCFCLTLNL